MTAFLITLASVLFAGAVFCLYGRQIASPALAYLSMLTLSFITENGYSVLPINSTMLMSWLAITLVVMFATMLQADAVKRQTRGMTYFVVGALAGLAVGLLGFSFLASVALRYTCMVLGVLVGTVLGFLVYTFTPDGTPLRPGSPYFIKYMLAKGFPTALTFMMAGVVLVLVIALKNVNGL